MKGVLLRDGSKTVIVRRYVYFPVIQRVARPPVGIQALRDVCLVEKYSGFFPRFAHSE
tara:strand:- start:853 stop:1026 length:174 start_codon:yes stop_codon:yes gene_type:complete